MDAPSGSAITSTWDVYMTRWSWRSSACCAQFGGDFEGPLYGALKGNGRQEAGGGLLLPNHQGQSQSTATSLMPSANLKQRGSNNSLALQYREILVICEDLGRLFE